MSDIKLRRARPADAVPVSVLLNHYAQDEVLLPRQPEEVLDNIRDFFVAEIDGKVQGCCALKIYGPELGEIRSLAVASEASGYGSGSKLLALCEDDAVANQIKRVFALTYIPGFFEKNGYKIVEKESLPQKIWRDCLKCSKFPDCQEIAVIKDLS